MSIHVAEGLFLVGALMITGVLLLPAILSEISFDNQFDNSLLTIILVLVIINFFRTKRIEEKVDAIRYSTTKSP